MTSIPEKETLRIGQGKPGPGRPKGKPNKTTALLKDAILKAAALAGADLSENAHADGLVEYLRFQAARNPQSFIPLLGKVLPTQLEGELVNTVYTISDEPMSADEWEREHATRG